MATVHVEEQGPRRVASVQSAPVPSDLEPQQAGASRGWLRAAMQGAALGLAVLVAGLGLTAGWIVGPPLIDDARMDWIVLAVVLDWRDFGDAAARQRLQYELDHQRINLSVSEEHCAFQLEPDGGREVRCDWEAHLELPLAGAVSLPFSSHARLDHDGRF
ncbi:MAG: hypothetical protein EA397_14690 [Deltaproteobacteria bacterium]|nr:MAG: hypothetical protein EA397_14690 [Deltaproteobacteria bacterium]